MIIGMGIKITSVDCRRCGHRWAPRVSVPTQCPMCKSTSWSKPRPKDKRRQDGFTLVEVFIVTAIAGLLGLAAYTAIYGESTHDMCARKCSENRAVDMGTCLTTCEVASDAETMSAVALGVSLGSAGGRR